MKITKTIVGAIIAIASVSTFAMGSSCDSDGIQKAKCHDNAVKHTKTIKGESVCPVAIWAAEAVGPDGKVLDEAVMIWETADGSTWIAKKVKPAAKHNHHSVKTADGKMVEPMTCADARDNKSDVKMDIVKSAAQCKENGSAKCDAAEHTKSVNGKAIVCSSADKKNADKKLTAEAKNNVANDGYFLVVEED